MFQIKNPQNQKNIIKGRNEYLINYKGRKKTCNFSDNENVYEDLPFHGLRSPPTQVSLFALITTLKLLKKMITRESCHYADWDFADYADGPIKYKMISELQAEDKKTGRQ